MYQVYGIRNCNTIKSTLDWLKTNQIDFVFHDYKKEGVTEEKLLDWCKQKGWEVLLNKKGSTWKAYDINHQRKIINEKTAVDFLLDKNSAIKRPIIEKDGKIIAIGFDETGYTLLFGK
jgi:Spx/MgsR family transcriptional regulator